MFCFHKAVVRPFHRSPQQHGHTRYARVSVKPLDQGLFCYPNRNQKKKVEESRGGADGGAGASPGLSLRRPPGGRGVGAASFLLLPHLHDVRALLRRRYVRHRRVLPLGGRLVLHLLFLDQRRCISEGWGWGGGTQRGRGLRGPLAMDLDFVYGWGRPRQACSFRSAGSPFSGLLRTWLCAWVSVRHWRGWGGFLSPISPPIVYGDLALPEDATSRCPPLSSSAWPRAASYTRGEPGRVRFCRPLTCFR